MGRVPINAMKSLTVFISMALPLSRLCSHTWFEGSYVSLHRKASCSDSQSLPTQLEGEVFIQVTNVFDSPSYGRTGTVATRLWFVVRVWAEEADCHWARINSTGL